MEFSCTTAAEVRGDPLAGTAFATARILLVEQPGPWGPGGLRDSYFDHRIAQELGARADAAGMRLLAIRRPGRSAMDGPRRWAVLDCAADTRASSWGTYREDAELLDVPLDGSAGTTSGDLVYLVCAHSRHDVCCAVRGRPVAAALAEIRPGQVWECSHVGGHRFAANMLVAPLGLLYGRVDADCARDLVLAAERGELVAGRLRGQVGLAPIAQAALIHAHTELRLRQVDALRVRMIDAVAEDTSTITLDGPRATYELAMRAERVPASTGLSCAKPGPDSYLRFEPAGALSVRSRPDCP
ncbi:MAG TPA: sucrase ferredoxin [Jatrophihabitantaceae bacterium]|jgi:hypothetical protein|nr:sucrase ferredoxin [Jatrophihabitantaceae bacterium]